MNSAPTPNPATVTLIQQPPRRGCVRYVILGILLLVLLSALGRLIVPATGLGMPLLGRSVAVVRIEGPINESTKVVRLIRDFRQNELVTAIVLRIDTPGGSVAASQEIYEEALKARTIDKKPVVVSMGNAAASGGYYIALAADEVFANHGTITGSIGVIGVNWNVEGILRRVQVDPVVLKSGEMKDTGSPLRRMSDADRHLLMGLIDDFYRQFVRAVLKARASRIETALADHPTRIDDILSTATTRATTETLVSGSFPVGDLARELGVAPALEEAVRWMADGRVYTGDQALALGLVDKIGTFTDAVERAGELSGLGKRPRTVERRPDSSLPALLGLGARQFREEFTRGGTTVEMRTETH